MNRLWLLRHAKSDWDTSAADFDRPLNKRGRKSSDQLGASLGEWSECPERVLCSPAARAVETLDRLCNAAGWSPENVMRDQRLYGADLEEFHAVLTDHAENGEQILVVAHNPGLEHWLRYLATGITTPEDGKLLPTAALASLSVNADWTKLEKGCAQLEWLQRVRDLKRS